MGHEAGSSGFFVSQNVTLTRKIQVTIGAGGSVAHLAGHPTVLELEDGQSLTAKGGGGWEICLFFRVLILTSEMELLAGVEEGIMNMAMEEVMVEVEHKVGRALTR